jgi:extradiol dioxygenase family protein
VYIVLVPSTLWTTRLRACFSSVVIALAKRLSAAQVDFVIEPTIRFQPGEQATMFLLDPAGNALEFKAIADPANLFAKG